MTLDDVAAMMRQRFTEAAGQGETEVIITQAEWNAMAEAIYIRDSLETILAAPVEQPLNPAIYRAAATALGENKRDQKGG